MIKYGDIYHIVIGNKICQKEKICKTSIRYPPDTYAFFERRLRFKKGKQDAQRKTA